MPHYVLIWVIANATGIPSSGSADFQTLPACESAKQDIENLGLYKPLVKCYPTYANKRPTK